MSKKVGVYICSGCEIGKSLDIEKLCQLASSEQNVAVCKSHKSLCSNEGFDIINNEGSEKAGTIRKLRYFY